MEHLLEPEMAVFEKEAVPGLPSSQFQKVIVDKHNELRAQNCAPPLVWDDGLAKQALECAKACPLTHKSKGGPAVCDTKGAGENLAWAGTTGTPRESAAAWKNPIQAWYDEHVDYDFTTGKSNNGKAVGHFTAIAWKSTTKVGCAININCDNKWPDPQMKNDAVVCRYSPGGNVIYNGGMSRYLSNVKAPESCGMEDPPVTEVDEDDTPPSGGSSGGGTIDFAVEEASDCNCGKGKCKKFWEESGAMSCSAGVAGSSSDGGKTWTYKCTCKAPDN